MESTTTNDRRIYTPMLPLGYPRSQAFPPSSFLIACSKQKQRRKAWYIYFSMWMICVYLGRQKGGGEGSPIERTHFMYVLFVSNLEWYVLHFANIRNSSAWGRNYKIRPQAHSFDGGPLYPSVYLHVGRHWRHSHDKNIPGLPPQFLHTASNQKLDGGKAWEWG